MLDMMKRHEIQVLRRAGHSQPDVAKLTGVSELTVRRVEGEPAVTRVEFQLSMAALSWELPRRLMLQTMLLAARIFW